MKTIQDTKADVGLFRVPDSKRKKDPEERSSNNDNPLVMTLRNTLDLLRDFTENGEQNSAGALSLRSKKWGLFLEGIKLSAIGLGGLALLTQTDDAEAKPVEKKKPETVDGEVVRELDKTKPENVPEPEKLPKNKTAKKSKKVESVDAAINRAARAAGEDPKQIRAIIHIESRGDPRARNGQHFGLGQISAAAWRDVAKEGTKLPKLTGDARDPRYDPYLNALVTAKYLGINRRRISKAAKEAGHKEPSLGLLYAAHNVGATTVNKILREKDPNKWDAKTHSFIGNQANELTEGGPGSYLKNTEKAMKVSYSKANIQVKAVNVSQAEDLGVMSSNQPMRVSARNRTEEPGEEVQMASVAPIQVAAISVNDPVQVSESEAVPIKRRSKIQVAQVSEVPKEAEPNAQPRRQSGGYSGQQPEPFRLPNGNLATA